MSSEIEQLRQSMRAAQVFGKGQYFQEGRYHLEVIKFFYKKTFIDGSSKENFICEFKVLASSRADVEIGSTRSTVFSCSHAGWLPRLKALMLALVGVDPDSKIPKEAEDATVDMYVAMRDDGERQRLGLPENFLAGRQVFAEAIPGKSKKGGDVTNMRWTPVDSTTGGGEGT